MNSFRRASLGAALLLMQLDCDASAQEGPKAYACTFKDGASFAYEKGAFNGAAAASDLAFEVAAIDMDKQTATLIVGEKHIPLKVVQAISATHFIELAGEGYLNLTTIYSQVGNDAAYPAVHSRHFGVLGQPLVSQYRGVCKPKG